MEQDTGEPGRLKWTLIPKVLRLRKGGTTDGERRDGLLKKTVVDLNGMRGIFVGVSHTTVPRVPSRGVTLYPQTPIYEVEE